MKLEAYIRNKAHTLGFGAVGFAAVGPSESSSAFQEWLTKGYGAEMHYLKRQALLRSDPRNLSPSARSIIVVAARYSSNEHNCPISNYARGADYHDVLKAKLSQLAAAINEKTGRPYGGCICVDSAPLPEREWAVRAGIGWIGKQGSVVSPEQGCCFFLGELIVNIELEPDSEHQPQCGSCRLCVDACPAGAILCDNLIDARKCLSYLTVEHQGEINKKEAARLGNTIFGCDRCTSVCPWNRRVKMPIMPEFDVPPSAVPPLEYLAGLDHKGFIKYFKDTPVDRIGFERFRRNVNIAMTNQKTMGGGGRPAEVSV